MAYATTSNVETELGRPALTPEELDQWQAWLDRVERVIARRFARLGYDLDAQVALGAPAAADVADVEVARVIDKINNPDSRMSSYTRSIDDASVTARSESGEALTITDEEWASILPTPPKRARAFSIMPS